MISPLLNPLAPIFWLQPLLYTAHGWLATKMALWLLFHPYEPYYVPGTGIQIPFTPGIFPRGRHKLSVAIADTVTEILLTQEDIRLQAEKLVTEQNIYLALDALADSLGRELRDMAHLRRLYRLADEALPPLLHQLVDQAIQGLERGDAQLLKPLFSRFFHTILPHMRLSAPQAEFVSGLIFAWVVTPDQIRLSLWSLLTDEGISRIESAMRHKAGPVQSLMLKFLDLRRMLSHLRAVLIESPEVANEAILRMMDHLELQEKLAERLMTLSPNQFTAEELETMRIHAEDVLTQVLIHHREAIAASLSTMGVQATRSLTKAVLLLFERAPDESTWWPQLKLETARFLHTYLHRELESMIGKALPIISMNQVIIDKIDQFSARELEETIQRICKRELLWLEVLGSFIGFWLGLFSNLIAAWSPGVHAGP